MNEIIVTLKQLISSGEPEESYKMLPLCHTLKNEGQFFEVLSGKTLPKQMCNEFNENVIYFFYGKAVFTDKDNFKDERLGIHPFALLYDVTAIKNNITRMYPFDTGGFNRYEILGFERKHFEIESPSLEELKNYIIKLFNNNENYLKNTLTIDSNGFPTCLPLKELVKLYFKFKNELMQQYGDQAFTAEIQYKEVDVEVNPQAVVMPMSYNSSDEAIRKWKQLFPNSELIFYNDGDKTTAILFKNIRSVITSYINENI